MKKTLLIAATLVSLSAEAQDEWNSTMGAGIPMYRDGSVGIGTSAWGGFPNSHFVVMDPANQGTHVSFGNNGLQTPYAPNESALEISSPNVTDNVHMDLVAGVGTNRYEFKMGLDVGNNVAGIYASSPVAGAVAQPIVFYTQNGILAEAMRVDVDGKVSIGDRKS